MLGTKRWKIPTPEAELDETFSREVPVSRVLSTVLWNRGIRTAEQARKFLNPTMADLRDPGLFDGMDLAVERARRAIEQGEKIMVHGDYDADGITSTALLVRVLSAIGADVTWYVPHRQRDGYDIRPPAIEAAREQGVGLVITADCGTSAVEAADLARSCGIDLIVTDHHEPAAEVADAFAMINPLKPGCAYPFKDLAGVGVAFKFAEALVRDCGYDVVAYRRKFIDLVAIGTVADVVPLLGENRILVKFGMEEIARTGKLGLRALVDRSGLGAKGITSRNIGFVLGPRLNAAGRLDDASLSVRLLLTKDEGEASRLADALETCNRERQAEQARMLQEAVSQIEKKRLDETAKIFVLSSAGWHPGVVGVVAGKITETYCRPTVMIALDDDGEMGVGSGRSIDGFNLFEALTECGALLEKFGGHAQAGGLSIVPGNLDEFDIAMNRHADQVLTECDLEPRVEADAEISLDAVTEDFIAELSLLEPYGHGNREPVFVTMGVPVLQKNTMGATGAHLKLRLGTPSGGTIDCVAFGWGAAAAAIRVGANIDVCYTASINDFNGSRNAQVMLRDARVSANRMGDALPSKYA